MNKKNIIIIVIVIALVALPWWRINQNSEFFVEGLMSHLSHLGDWTYQDHSTSISGDISIEGVQFKPRGYQDIIRVESITVTTDARDLLFTKSTDLLVKLPPELTVNFNQVKVVNPQSELQNNILKSNYFPMVLGYLGAFGCGDGTEPSFTSEQWQAMNGSEPVFDVKLTYALLEDDYSIDFNININSPDNWYTTWSGGLIRPNDDERLAFHDTIIDTLYYYYADQGFNEKRNQFCGKDQQSTFAAYRLNSSEALQQILRVYAGGEMSPKLANQYQRSLQPQVEYNAILKLKQPKYIFEVADWSQSELFKNSDIEAALGEQEYQDIKLSKIDHLDLDIETLRVDMEQRQKIREEREAQANKPKELIRQIKTHVGGQQKREYTLTNWSDAIGQSVKIKTKRGRPIFGTLKAINDNQVTVSTRFKSGDATINISRKDVLSISIAR
ncbi:LSm family protein [Marinicella gelatinilytica]|uniref:hypothetical protein n=1 Tax=Marinicella gelatinilytica TaxID=2996017 RepID=UPI002260B983|nr:hypothetical protein [Marinicella gelatinilytica]MCX7545638.1 hypothetical protein [Marinicella gelatinilytica]